MQTSELSAQYYYLYHKNEFRGEDGHEKLLKLLIDHVPQEKDGMTVIGIDVGANVGKYIPDIKKICTESDHKIICIEPNPLNFDILKKMSVDKTLLFNCAVSNKNSVMPFYSYHNDNYVGNPHGGLFSHQCGKHISNVEVNTLDSIVQSVISGTDDYVIKFVKIDTEGHDTMIIEGMSNILPKTRYIIFECSDCLDDFRGPGIKNPMKRIVTFLDKRGFDVYRIGTKRLLKVNGDDWDDLYEQDKFWSNCFAAKKGDPLMEIIVDKNGFFKV